jgi:ATP-binding cassette subfamily G (WHITE) protein 2
MKECDLDSNELSKSQTKTPISPPVLAWSNLTVVVKKNGKEKKLLNSVSGCVAGGLWAILGASGSGKTTLLSALSKRLNTNKMSVRGQQTINGAGYDKPLLKMISAYAMQDDLLYAELTIEQTLNFCAQLKMPTSTTKLERTDRDDSVISLMAIEHCRSVRVGDARHKGISGGERKRLSIAMELLSNPLLIFLDEPTSGLDSGNALSVCEALKNLCETSTCSILCTIHQPQQKIFNLFDRIMLMRKGEIVFQGSPDESLLFISKEGYVCPPNKNPADFLLEVISLKKADLFLIEPSKVVVADVESGLDPLYFHSKPGWFSQVKILLHRNMKLLLKHYDRILMNIISSGLIGIFVGLGVWRNIGNTQSSQQYRSPALFFSVMSQGIVSSLQGMHSFPLERALVLRERAAGTYSASAYFVSKTLADWSFQLIPPIIYSCIVYPLVGFQKGANKFFMFMLFMILDTFAATSLATMCCCLCVSLEMTTVVVCLLFEISRLYGGWFISPANVHMYPKWKFADALSFIKYAFVGVCQNEYQGLQLKCLPKEFVNGKCPITSGEQVMAKMGYNLTTIGYNIGILIVYIVGCRLVSYWALRRIKR